MDNDIVIKFLTTQNFDLRIKKNNPRFIDQKCTPDVVSFIADCVIHMTISSFSRKDIQKSKLFLDYTRIIFGKPSPNNKLTASEYDKFILQPLDLFAYAGILHKTKKGNGVNFSIVDSAKDILEYIALKDRNAYLFLVEYLKKVFSDSGFGHINNFLRNPSKDNFVILKEQFERFLISNSNIGSRGSSNGGIVEIRRIFAKAINPLALDAGVAGAIKGHISKQPIEYTDLIYNRENFRDVGKLHNLTRKEDKKIKESKETLDYNKLLLNKAKEWVKKTHPYSEVNDKLYGPTAQIHHIFPKNEFPTIADYIENLVALTSGQHTDKAHPKGKTIIIDVAYQYICLKAKSNTIQKAISSGITPYSRTNFIFVVNTGFKWLGTNSELSQSLNFPEIDKNIDLYYKTN